MGTPIARPAPGTGPLPGSAERALAEYLKARRKELSTCWVLMPVGSTSRIPKQVLATFDLVAGRARAIELTTEGVPLALRECLANKIALWGFPVNEEVQLEVPLEVSWSN
jgi:hypothetical protein